ncbi:hypothetical protein QQF64_022299, partial [Cirrhinus molitorella]
MTAGETYSESIEMEAGLVTADKEDYHPQRMCPTLTRHRSVQLTRQQKAWRSALLGSIADDHKAEDMCSTLKRPSCSPIGQECLNNGGALKAFLCPLRLPKRVDASPFSRFDEVALPGPCPEERPFSSVQHQTVTFLKFNYLKCVGKAQRAFFEVGFVLWRSSFVSYD